MTKECVETGKFDLGFEIKYYKKGVGLHEPKKALLEADTKQEAFDDFKDLYPNTVVLDVKSVKVMECIVNDIP